MRRIPVKKNKNIMRYSIRIMEKREEKMTSLTREQIAYPIQYTNNIAPWLGLHAAATTPLYNNNSNNNNKYNWPKELTKLGGGVVLYEREKKFGNIFFKAQAVIFFPHQTRKQWQGWGADGE